MLDDFPECSELGYCKVRVGGDVTCGIDYEKMNRHTIHALNGFQSAAVSLEGWGGKDDLQGLVCSVFIAAGREGSPVAEFQFQDMRTAEAEADAVEVDGHALFCSTVESASERWDRPYLVIPTEVTPEWRQSAGLPAESYLDCGNQLSQTAGKIPGIHTPYEYISSDIRTATGMHVEDAWLCSINVVLAGAPKVWLMVPPRFQKALEAQVQNHLAADRPRSARRCSQSVRHMDALLSPLLLDSWGIPYDIVVCKAGQMVVTLPGTYHQVINAGPNYAQAINFAMPGWMGPPSGYRFCGKACPQSDAPTPEHFRVQRVSQSKSQQNPSGEGSADNNLDERDKDREEEKEDGGAGREVSNDTDGSEVYMEDLLDQSNQEENEVDKKRQEEMHPPERNAEAGRIQRHDECDLGVSQGADGVGMLLGTLVYRGIPINQSNGRQLNAVQALHKHMANELGTPRKRRISLAGENTESGDEYWDNNDSDSTSSLAQKSVSDNSSHLHIFRTVSESRFDQWSVCVLRAAEGGGFNVQGVVQAFHSAPDNEPIGNVLRALQCICEIANIALLLQVRQRLLTDPAAMAAIDIPAASDDVEDVQKLVRLHHDISTLRTVCWTAKYHLALQQLQYYEQFEALVKKNRTRAARDRNERRNCKKRKTTRGASLGEEPSQLPPIRTEVLVKRQIISSTIGYGITERIAKDDLEKYLERGKKLHLFLGSASQSLLALFPLYGTNETRPSLDLLSYGPPDDISKLEKLRLGRPIESSW
ncbi:putative transcription factor jumonji aspartyl beta-hydroxylase protein [Lasiodiplodia theobromae]|nr:putative transcription factor jumonji aspartyl beta-hydroxylase protein [Lasiodiplodia theobromae]